MKKIEMLNGEVKYFEEVDGSFKEVEKPSRWKPAYNDEYYYIDSVDIVWQSKWNSSREHDFRYNFNNCFKTRKEANRKSEIMKLIYENIGRNKEECRGGGFVVVYGSGDNHLWADGFMAVTPSPYYFPTKEIAEMIIDKVGVEDWKKYVLGIYE